MNVRRYPDHPGAKGRAETGHAAAAAFAPKAGTRQAEALSAIEHLGEACAEQIAQVTSRHWYCIRPRLSELAALGLIADTGRRSETPLGGKTIVWRITTAVERAEFAARQAAEVGAMSEAAR